MRIEGDASRLEDSVRGLRAIADTPSPTLSIYLNLYPEILEPRSTRPRLHELLHPIEELAASESPGRGTSMSLRRQIGRVLETAEEFEKVQGPAVAAFMCDEPALEIVFALPKRAWDCAIVGSAPYLRPVDAILDGTKTVAAVVLESSFAEITVSRMGQVLEERRIDVEELRKSNLAGWHGLEEYRIRQHAEEVRHHLLREVAAQLYRWWRDSRLELVLVGGQERATASLLPFLSREIRAITRTFVTDVHTLTPQVLAKTVAELEDEIAADEEALSVAETYSRFADDGLAAIGPDRVTRAANSHAISHLLIHDGARVDGATCPSCASFMPATTVCPYCGERTRPVPDLIDSLARAVVEAQGTVDHVRSPTRLADDLVAAQLRYQVA